MRVPASTDSELRNISSPSGPPDGLFAVQAPMAARIIAGKWPSSSTRGAAPASAGGCTSPGHQRPKRLHALLAAVSRQRVPHRIAAQNAVALLAAGPGPVSMFLGDSEKPNHRDWVARRAEAKGYKNPNLPLRIIKNALRDLHALTTLPGGREGGTPALLKPVEGGRVKKGSQEHGAWRHHPLQLSPDPPQRASNHHRDPVRPPIPGAHKKSVRVGRINATDCRSTP